MTLPGRNATLHSASIPLSEFIYSLLADSAPDPARPAIRPFSDPPPVAVVDRAPMSEPVAQTFHDWDLQHLDAWTQGLTSRKPRAHPARREPVKRSPRCPVCGEFIRHSKGALATRFVDGREVHRLCLGDE